ncbi:MAG TPA: thermonuclease family protein [Ignavibacteria bacterium]
MKSLIKVSSKLIFTAVILVAFIYFGSRYVIPKLDQKDNKEKVTNGSEKRNIYDPNFYPVTKVFDGDTFEVEIDGKREKIRMLGIDTPEKWESGKLDKDAQRTGKDKKTIKVLGDLASEYTKKLISGKKVRLEIDPIGDERDRYGRMLRYVYLEDGTLVNLKIVEDGYANAYRRFEVSKKNEFIEAEKRARENRRGLWGDIEGLNYMGESDK